MKFGPCRVEDSAGSYLAHSLVVGSRHLRKGVQLTSADVADLKRAGTEQVIVARLGADDIHEDEAALQLGQAITSGNTLLSLGRPFTGRVNIFSNASGLCCIDADGISRVNAIDPSLTIATLNSHSPVRKGTLLATIKIIPFATQKDLVQAAKRVAAGTIRVAPFAVQQASLILTLLPDQSEKLTEKGIHAVSNRLENLGCRLSEITKVPHSTDALGQAVRNSKSDLTLILTASATSDENDIGPAALKTAGGVLTRFGMPVDPGNLLFLGQIGSKTVVGLPGCARSPALNGADWVLERLIAGLSVSASDIAGMGVGGLLKEVPSRSQPRVGSTQISSRPHVEIILLAAGASSRMKGVDKLLENIGGRSLLTHAAEAALGARSERVIAVLPPQNALRAQAVADLNVELAIAPNWQHGMASSIRSGLAQVTAEADAVIIALADMPEVTADHFDRLIDAYNPASNQEICRAVTEDGTAGHPILFGRRFFESLGGLRGDHGGREILREASHFLIDVPTEGQSATVDLDTPDDWAQWRKSSPAGP